ncbi:sulfatase-like hydrolase/transferase [Saccharicrinis sp. GN24d3]|uniref:sulfatase-like hydrolase/transferase n=1 Tax=Saccharicrinis sp. GN24d3 TaxID=3458416 RepID=UPI004036D1BB
MKIKVAIGILFVLLFNSCSDSKTKKTEKPNIIFLFADDQCYNTINALGNKEVITPNLDKLAGEGVTFTQAYNMGAWHGAVCVASRTMINSGRFVWNAMTIEKQLKEPEVQSQLWGNLMKEAGYDTYMAGKWHVKAIADSCFETLGTVRGGMPKQTKEGYNRPLSPEDTTWKPYDTAFGGFWEGGKHWSEVLGDEAIGFIDQAKEKENPFFMYIAFNAAHDPRQSPREFVDMYPLENISTPETYMDKYPYEDQIGCGKGLRDERLAPFPRTEYSVKVNRQEYYAIITHLDQQIGRIWDALEKSGKKDNTYIFYTADHGLACGNHGLMGKQNMYEHSMRPPLMVIGPDLPKGEKVDMDVYLQDIMPSSLELAGVEKPACVEFSSLMDLARQKNNESAYQAIYGCYKNLQRMIKKDGYKLIAYPKANKLLLFDLENDPLEMENLAEKEEYQTKVKELFLELVELQKSMSDSLDLEEVFTAL